MMKLAIFGYHIGIAHRLRPMHGIRVLFDLANVRGGRLDLIHRHKAAFRILKETVAPPINDEKELPTGDLSGNIHFMLIQFAVLLLQFLMCFRAFHQRSACPKAGLDTPPAKHIFHQRAHGNVDRFSHCVLLRSRTFVLYCSMRTDQYLLFQEGSSHVLFQ